MQPISVGNQQYDKLYRRLLVFWIIVSGCYVYAVVPAYNFPVLKLVAGGLMVLSEVLLIRLALLTYKTCKEDFSIGIRIVIWLAIIYNIGHILYGCFWDDKYVPISYFGNPVYQPAFMLPVCLFLGMHIDNFINSFKYVTFYSLFYLLSYVITPYPLHFIGLCFVIILAFLSYMPRKWRVVVLAIGVFYIITGYYDGARAAVVRAVAGIVICVGTLFPSWWSKTIRIIVFVAGIVLPLLMVRAFVNEGFSIFEYAESQKVVLMSEEGVGEGDSRTFLYEEVFEDMSNNNSWILGKGINGTYYSDYFARKRTEGGDVENRIQSEVGFLNILLKGGIVQSIFYSFFLIVAIFNCLLRSESKFMLVIGLILLVHFIMLFIEEYVKYDIYNIMMWIMIGMSLSSSWLGKDDEDFVKQFNTIFS